MVAASRTLSTDTRWWFVNVRLLFNFVKSSLRDGLRFVRQEPHTEELRRSVRFNVVRPFLLGLWRRGAFGSDPPEHGVQRQVRRREQPSRPRSTWATSGSRSTSTQSGRPRRSVIVVGQQPSGASAGEA